MLIGRIQAELAEILLDPPCGIIAAPKDNNMYMCICFVRNRYEWEAKLDGPEDSPYAGGIFFLDIHFPDDYPFQPPKVLFWHCLYCVDYFSNTYLSL